MKIGDVVETAIWLDGTETELHKVKFLTEFGDFLGKMADEEGYIFGPIKTSEKKPGEDRVPPVPDEIQGPDVKLYVIEAEIVKYLPKREGKFVADLEPKDLERLRSILRRVHQAWNPGKPPLSDEKCDEYININGPDAALAALREQVGVKVH